MYIETWNCAFIQKVQSVKVSQEYIWASCFSSCWLCIGLVLLYGFVLVPVLNTLCWWPELEKKYSECLAVCCLSVCAAWHPWCPFSGFCAVFPGLWVLNVFSSWMFFFCSWVVCMLASGIETDRPGCVGVCNVTVDLSVFTFLFVGKFKFLWNLGRTDFKLV